MADIFDEALRTARRGDIELGRRLLEMLDDLPSEGDVAEMRARIILDEGDANRATALAGQAARSKDASISLRELAVELDIEYGDLGQALWLLHDLHEKGWRGVRLAEFNETLLNYSFAFENYVDVAKRDGTSADRQVALLTLSLEVARKDAHQWDDFLIERHWIFGLIAEAFIVVARRDWNSALQALGADTFVTLVEHLFPLEGEDEAVEELFLIAARNSKVDQFTRAQLTVLTLIGRGLGFGEPQEETVSVFGDTRVSFHITDGSGHDLVARVVGTNVEARTVPRADHPTPCFWEGPNGLAFTTPGFVWAEARVAVATWLAKEATIQEIDAQVRADSARCQRAVRYLQDHLLGLTRLERSGNRIVVHDEKRAVSIEFDDGRITLTAGEDLEDGKVLRTVHGDISDRALAIEVDTALDAIGEDEE